MEESIGAPEAILGGRVVLGGLRVRGGRSEKERSSEKRPPELANVAAHTASIAGLCPAVQSGMMRGRAGRPRDS